LVVCGGVCGIAINQGGDVNFNAAVQVVQTFNVLLGTQSISFTTAAPTNAAVGGVTYTPGATSNRGLAGKEMIWKRLRLFLKSILVVFSTASPGICSIANGVVSFQASGTCVVNANAGGNALYNAAAQISQTFAVAKGNQVLSFSSSAPPNAQVGGATYTPSAVSTAGLPVTITVDPSSSTICSFLLGVVSFQASGTCLLNANQAGSAAYNPAGTVSAIVVVFVFFLKKKNNNNNNNRCLKHLALV
jgi:hypothetical protein